MKLSKYLKKKEEPKVSFDYSFLQTDIHSHLIPGIDDGSPLLEDSLLLIKGMVDLGYKKLITTPHVMSDYYRNTPVIIQNGLEQLRELINEHKIPVTIEAAAEYYLDYEFSQKLSKQNVLTFGSNYLLVECSFVEPPANLDQIIFEIQINGYKPVLAHAERYLYWSNNFRILNSLKERDVLFQLNLLSLTGAYSKAVEKTARYLIENQFYDFIGTDLHHLKHLELLKNLEISPELDEKIKALKLLNSCL
jgi:tyrosine-protein phosphatase YwqE